MGACERARHNFSQAAVMYTDTEFQPARGLRQATRTEFQSFEWLARGQACRISDTKGARGQVYSISTSMRFCKRTDVLNFSQRKGLQKARHAALQGSAALPITCLTCHNDAVMGPNTRHYHCWLSDLGPDCQLSAPCQTSPGHAGKR